MARYIPSWRSGRLWWTHSLSSPVSNAVGHLQSVRLQKRKLLISYRRLKFYRRTSRRNSTSRRGPKICRESLVLIQKIAKTRKKIKRRCLPSKFKSSLRMGLTSTMRKDLTKTSNTTTRTTMLFLCNKRRLVFRTIR